MYFVITISLAYLNWQVDSTILSTPGDYIVAIVGVLLVE